MKYNYLDITPSELNAGFHCRRRFALQRNRQFVDTGFRGVELACLADLLPPETLYEVSFPQGFRADAWLPSEKLAIEYKSGEPRQGDILQCWMMVRVMHEAGISDFSMQLWYGSKYKRSVAELAVLFGYPVRNIGDEILAIRIDFDPIDETGKLEPALAVLRRIDLSVLPDLHPQGSVQCEGCLYHDYCHI